jgi:hypothetical protein
VRPVGAFWSGGAAGAAAVTAGAAARALAEVLAEVAAGVLAGVLAGALAGVAGALAGAADCGLVRERFGFVVGCSAIGAIVTGPQEATSAGQSDTVESAT